MMMMIMLSPPMTFEFCNIMYNTLSMPHTTSNSYSVYHFYLSSNFSIESASYVHIKVRLNNNIKLRKERREASKEEKEEQNRERKLVVVVCYVVCLYATYPSSSPKKEAGQLAVSTNQKW